MLKFFNNPNVYLGMVENQLKGLRKGGYAYGAMLAWQMVFVLFMSSQLCLHSSKKPVWVEPCREVAQTPSSGKLLSVLRQKQFQASWGRQKIHRIKMVAWSSCLKTLQGWEVCHQAKLAKVAETLPGTREQNLLSDSASQWVGWKQSSACKDRGNMG